jgi:hypothetical protein
VPHVYDADGFLTYMSGTSPKLVANDAGVVAPNTLHIVRMYPGAPVAPLALAAMWQTSLSALSCELEGHSLGGGMLKLEPTEARRVAVALPDLAPARVAELADDVDRLLRRGNRAMARAHADKVVLQEGIGLTASEIKLLHDGWNYLRERRHHR